MFTDPPFGSNIFYSDMNLFQEAWLGETTDCASEAVVYTTGKRKNGAGQRYEALLRNAFEETWRILKPGRHMSIVFGNSSGRVWGLVQRALCDAGFRAAPWQSEPRSSCAAMVVSVSPSPEFRVNHPWLSVNAL